MSTWQIGDGRGHNEWERLGVELELTIIGN